MAEDNPSNQSTTFSNITDGVTEPYNLPANNQPPLQLPPYFFGVVSLAMWQEFLVYFVKTSFFVVSLGTVCSVLNVIMYEKQQRISQKQAKRREVHVSFLIAISVGDGLFTFCKVVSYLVDFLFPDNTYLQAHLDTYLDVYGITAFRRAAVWMNALASLERFLTIAFPLGTASYVFKKAPTAVISVVFISCCLAHIFIFFEFHVVQKADGTWTQFVTPFRAANEALYESIKNAIRIIFFYVPLFGSLLLNLMLMAALKRHAASKKGMTTSRGGGDAKDGTASSAADDAKQAKNSTEAKAAKLILVVTLTFFFMALPSTLNATVATFTPHYGVPKREVFLYGILLNVFNLIMYLTQVAMLIISVALSHRLRAALLAVLCKCRQLQQASRGEKSSSASTGGMTLISSAPSVSE